MTELQRLVDLLATHPGAGLLARPANWDHALKVISAHLDNRARDNALRRGLIEALAPLLTPGLSVTDDDILRLVTRLVTTQPEKRVTGDV